MAARWLVNQKDNQLTVDGLSELVAMAKEGRLRAGDMVQPPGASDWLYASEIPELKDTVKDDVQGMSDTGRTMAILGISAGLLLATIVGVAVAIYAYTGLPDGSDTIVGGEHGLKYGQMLVTADGVSLHGDADAASPATGSVEKDAAVTLLAKKNDMWQVRTEGGAVGWVGLDQVLPIYQLGDAKLQAKYDPLYNPHHYVQIGNAAWNLADKSETKTIFKFMVTNAAIYKMTDLKMAATVKDDKGAEMERVEFPVEGEIPASDDVGTGQTFIGTLLSDDKAAPPRVMTEYTFMQMAKDQPELQTKWSEGVEVEMKTKDFSAATIDVIDVQAVPEGAPTE